VKDKAADGSEQIRGSHLIAQPFTDDAYFWPRPSAASFNATASGASNYGASNPNFAIALLSKSADSVYKKDSPSLGTDKDKPRTPQMDIEDWFAAKTIALSVGQ